MTGVMSELVRACQDPESAQLIRSELVERLVCARSLGERQAVESVLRGLFDVKVDGFALPLNRD